MKKVRPLIEAMAIKHDFQLGVPNSAMLVHAANSGEGEYQRGELLLTVWNNWLRYSIGRVVFGGGVRKRMGFTVWFDQDWQPQKAVNDLEVELPNLELAELEMAELIEAIYLPSDKVEKWRQPDDVTIPPHKPRLVIPRVWDPDAGLPFVKPKPLKGNPL